MAPTWPETMLTTIQFFSEGENQSRIHLKWEILGHATPEEVETFVKGRSGMTQGWTGSLDRLEDYIGAK